MTQKKIILVGASGTIGRAVHQQLRDKHQVIAVGHRNGDYQVDMMDENSIIALFKQIGVFDALVITAGQVRFKPLSQINMQDYLFGAQHKLLGQVGLVFHGMKTIRDKGSFTLTSGVASEDPIVGSTSASMVNSALDGFVKSAAIDLPRGLRINAVSPTILSESMKDYGDFFQGFKPVPAHDVALAYVKSIEGAQTGQVYQVW